MFKKDDAQVAANIIKLYFSFFKACVKLVSIPCAFFFIAAVVCVVAQ